MVICLYQIENLVVQAIYLPEEHLHRVLVHVYINKLDFFNKPPPQKKYFPPPQKKISFFLLLPLLYTDS